MNFRGAKPVATALFITLWLTASLQAQTQDLMIRNAILHTVEPAGILRNVDVRIVRGVIDEIGENLPPGNPATRTLDAGSRIVTPALFAGVNSLGLEDVSAEAQTLDTGFAATDETGLGALRPEFDVTRAFNPHSSLIPITRVEGYAFALLAARRAGSIIAGQGRVVTLDGGYRSFRGEPTLFIDLGASASSLSGGSRAGQWMLLEQAFAESKSGPGTHERALLTPAGRASLAGFSRGGRVVFSVDRASDILAVIEFSAAHSLSAVIAGGAEAWMVSEQLARANIPVILDPLVNLPDNFDRLGARLDNAALLHRAGVTIAFAQTPDMETHNARRMRQLAGNAVAHGLPHGAALEALTVNPARIFGVGEETGSIARGKRGDLVIWSGDPLEVTSVAEQVVIGGSPVPLITRQTLLRDRYLDPDPGRPRAYVRPSGR